MLQYLTYFQNKLKQWKDRRFLKKHGCETWAQYNRWFDPDYNRRASRIRDYYHGYPHWTIIENHNHQIYWWDMAYDGSSEIVDWCEENLTSKYRFDCLRVINCPATANEREINELGGTDYYFFACQDPKDFFLFAMRWGG